MVTEQLPSWTDGPARGAIVDFVASVTTPGGATFVPPADRIATFDNDGTLWLEKPMYFQLQEGLGALAAMVAATPEVGDRQPFKAVQESDLAWLQQVGADYASGDPRGLLVLAGGITEA